MVRSGRVPSAPPPPALSDADLAGFLKLAFEAAGISLAANKREMLITRLAPRLRALGLASYRAYYQHLLASGPDSDEREQFINCITTNKTSFFREPHHFDFLRDRLIPQLRARVAAGAPRKLRLWSAACSSGEEPYSLAMVAHRELARDGYSIEIIASDIDTEILAHAHEGRYPRSRLADVPAEYRHYVARDASAGEHWRVSGELRALVQFHHANLIHDAFPVPGPFDAVFLRNVIIYFDRATQTRLINRLRGYLAETSYLFLGHSESLLHVTSAFIPAGPTIYRLRPRIPSRTARHTGRHASRTARHTRQPQHPAAPPTAQPTPTSRMPADAKIKVLVVDDSALMRQLLGELLSLAGDIDVIGTAPDPFAAWQLIKTQRPDVVTLDVEMPRMDGISFLTKLMAHYPLPVVMVSSLTQDNCETSLRALELGAVDIVAKPTANVLAGVRGAAEELIDKVRAAARARVHRPRDRAAARQPTGYGVGGGVRTTHAVIAIGASTGGTEAIREVLTAFPPDSPGIVVVQHMPPQFTAPFAERLARLCQIKVREARHGDRVLPGHALIAPGGYQLSVVRSGALSSVAVTDAPPVNRHRPSVDVLFSSCARQLGRNAVGVILTGMGNDGAAGLKEMRDAGAHTIAQDEASCVVFGMPREAIEAGAAVEVMALERIGPALAGRGSP